MSKAAVVINKKSGYLVEYPELNKSHFKELFVKNNIEADIYFIESTELALFIKALENKTYDFIVIGGGDGTIHSVINALPNFNLPIGILPLGTLNHLAKDLNLPLDLEECIQVLKRPRYKKIDLGYVNNQYFINNSSIGIYPKIIRYRNLQMKWYRMSKWSALFLSAINIFHRFPLYQIELVSQQQSLQFITPLAFIGNNEYELSLFTYRSRKNINQGKLCLYIANSQTRLQFLKLLLLFLIGQPNQSRDFTQLLTSEIFLVSRRKKIDVAMDGEHVTMENPLHYQIKPDSLTLLTKELE